MNDEDANDTQPLGEPEIQSVESPKPFKVGDKVNVEGHGPATIHQIFGNGDVLEVAVPSVVYVTVSKDIVTRIEDVK